MSNRKPRKFDCVFIKWLDACNVHGEWQKPDRLIKVSEGMQYTVAFYYGEYGKYTHIAQSYHLDTGSKDGVMAVPTSTIQEIRVLRRALRDEIPSEDEE